LGDIRIIAITNVIENFYERRPPHEELRNGSPLPEEGPVF